MFNLDKVGNFTARMFRTLQGLAPNALTTKRPAQKVEV